MKNLSPIVEGCQALEECLQQAYEDTHQLVLKNAEALGHYKDDIKGQRFVLGMNRIFLQNANETRYKFEPRYMSIEGPFSAKRFFQITTRLSELGVPSEVSYKWLSTYFTWSNFVSDASEIIDEKAENPYEMMKGLWDSSRELKKLIGLTQLDIDHFLIHVLMDKKSPESFESEISHDMIFGTITLIGRNRMYLKKDREYFEKVLGKKTLELVDKFLMEED